MNTLKGDNPYAIHLFSFEKEKLYFCHQPVLGNEPRMEVDPKLVTCGACMYRLRSRMGQWLVRMISHLAKKPHLRAVFERYADRVVQAGRPIVIGLRYRADQIEGGIKRIEEALGREVPGVEVPEAHTFTTQEWERLLRGQSDPTEDDHLSRSRDEVGESSE